MFPLKEVRLKSSTAGLFEHTFAVVVAIKAGVNVKAVLTSLNTPFLPISRSRFKRH